MARLWLLMGFSSLVPGYNVATIFAFFQGQAESRSVDGVVTTSHGQLVLMTRLNWTSYGTLVVIYIQAAAVHAHKMRN